MYVKVSTRLTSGIIEVKEYGAGGYGAPGKKRKKRKNISPEAVKKYNAKTRERRLQNLILLNFSEGWNITLRYTDKTQPKDYEEAKNNLRLFRDSMRRELNKYGIKFKYIMVTEKGKKANHYHHHIVVESLWDEAIDIREFVKAKWEKYGTTYNSKLHDEGNYKKLAEYLAKSETKEDVKKKHDEGYQEATYQISRNLKKPEVIEKVSYYGDMKEPEAPSGWYVDTESLIQGINPYTGKKYQRYFIKNSLEKVIERALEEKEKQEEADIKRTKVNLYLESKIIDKEGWCNYVLEFIKADGTAITRDATAAYEGSKTSLTLRALIAGMSLLNKPSQITIYTGNPVVKNAIKNDWMEKWKKQKWKNGKGEYVASAGLWKYLTEHMGDHKLLIASDKEKNTYHNWQLQELDNAVKRKGTK